VQNPFIVETGFARRLRIRQSLNSGKAEDCIPVLSHRGDDFPGTDDQLLEEIRRAGFDFF